MTDSTPPSGLDSPPSTGTPQPLPPPTPDDQHDQQERGEGKGRRATDEEPRQRTRNFSACPYIERTPPRYTPKDTPAACILHRLQRPFSARLASRADRLQFCFWRVCRTRRPKRPTTDATNARPPAPCHQWTGEPLHFQPAAISDEMTQYLYSIASTHFLSFFPR